MANVVRPGELICVPFPSSEAMMVVGRKLTRKLVSGLIKVTADVLLVNIGRLVVFVVRHTSIVVFVRPYGNTSVVSTIMKARRATGIGAFGTGMVFVTEVVVSSMVNSADPKMVLNPLSAVAPVVDETARTVPCTAELLSPRGRHRTS